MASSSAPLPDQISLETFQQALARYPAVIEAVSDAKGAKPGQQTLAELDAFRYEEAPARFGLSAGAEALTLDDAKTLVAWKLRHGKFRPTLMKMVASNDPAEVDKAVADALERYKSMSASAAGELVSPAPGAVRLLADRLRGVGPATASLLLAVHDPARVVFFGDEVYAWLCGGPDHSMPKKYDHREYQDVARRAAGLQKRLGGAEAVRAVDIEKVAYVLLAGGKAGEERKDKGKVKEEKKKEGKAEPKTKTEEAPPQKDAGDKLPIHKRKKPPTDTGPASTAPVRRSQRARKA